MPAPRLKVRAIIYVPPSLVRARGRRLNFYIAKGLPAVARELEEGVRPFGLVYGVRSVRTLDVNMVEAADRLARRYRTRRSLVLSRALALGAGVDMPRVNLVGREA